MTMRRSPRRPLILKRRKLPFQQHEPPTAEVSAPSVASATSKPPKPPASQSLPEGIHFMDHPSMSDTQVVVIPKAADLKSIIGALTARSKERGAQGPTKFILLGGSDNCQSTADADEAFTGGEVGQLVRPDSPLSFPHAKALSAVKARNKVRDCSSLDNSLTNMQWLDQIVTSEPDPPAQTAQKENDNPNSQEHGPEIDKEASVNLPVYQKPPYSYVAMIQFAINSRPEKRMTLKEIYTWMEDHFPYFKDTAKPGWKNSIRHNLSLHDMFIRETLTDDKVSYWTIRPEANRCLTLDQVYTPGCDPAASPVPVPLLLFPNQHRNRIPPDTQRTASGSERKMKRLLPRTESYLVPIQLPIASSVYVPSTTTSAQIPSSRPPQKRNTPLGGKRVRIAPKVADENRGAVQLNKEIKVEVKQEPICVPIKCETPKALPKRQARSSRRKQCLLYSLQEEPLLFPDNTLCDSGVASDASTFHDRRDPELEEQHHQYSPNLEFSFRTPVKSASHLSSSTPSKPLSSVLPEPWKVTPLGKGSQNILDFSPIRTPGGPAVTPVHEFTTFSFSSTPFKDWPLFNSPKESLTSHTDSGLRSSCSRALLPAGAGTHANRSLEGLVLDTMNDSLSKILVDISFPGLDEDDLGMANISWSEIVPQLK